MPDATESSSLGRFLAYYEAAHQQRTNRAVHHVAHAIGFSGLVSLPFNRLSSGALIALAFALSWTGHYLFERNTPAFFDAPTSRVPGAGLLKKAQVALGGLVWSGACLLKVFKVGALAKAK